MHLGRYDNSPSRKIFWIFCLVAIIAAGVIINILVSRATIVIHPKIEKKITSVNLTLDSAADKPDLARGVISGKILESQGDITKNITDVSSRKTDDFAKGTVTIKNIWKKDFFLRQGAQLVQGDSPETVGASPKNLFLLDQDTNVPANGEIEAGVTAKVKGVVGNISTGKFYFLRMSQWNRDRIWAENLAEFSGGETEQKIITQEDINKATHSVAEEDLGKREMENFRAKIDPDLKIIPALTRVEILDSRASATPDTVADSFSLFVSGKVSSIAYNERDLLDMAVEKFKEQISNNQEVSDVDSSGIKYQLVSLDSAGGKAAINVEIPAVLTPKLPSKLMDKKSIIGYNEAALRERFAKFPEISSIETKFFPFWVKSVPNFESQTSLEINTN